MDLLGLVTQPEPRGGRRTRRSRRRPSLDLLAVIRQASGVERLLRPEWQVHAACRGAGPERFFTDPTPSERAALEDGCRTCPVLIECDHYARWVGAEGWWAGALRKDGLPRKGA